MQAESHRAAVAALKATCRFFKSRQRGLLNFVAGYICPMMAGGVTDAYKAAPTPKVRHPIDNLSIVWHDITQLEKGAIHEN
jgi:hypothetical protein